MDKDTSFIKKISYIFDRKQKLQLAVLGVMIFIGGFLETLGVGAMMPVVTALIAPDTVQQYISQYGFLQDICDFWGISDMGQVTTILLLGLMAVYVIKNLYLLFLTYRQNSFITQNRNKVIDRKSVV